jgi:hypothetical protein
MNSASYLNESYEVDALHEASRLGVHGDRFGVPTGQPPEKFTAVLEILNEVKLNVIQ